MIAASRSDAWINGHSTVATRRDHGCAIFQALKRLAKFMPPLRGAIVPGVETPG